MEDKETVSYSIAHLGLIEDLEGIMEFTLLLLLLLLMFILHFVASTDPLRAKQKKEKLMATQFLTLMNARGKGKTLTR